MLAAYVSEQKLFSSLRLLITAAAFVLYILSAGVLYPRHAGLLFGSDAHLYAEIATGQVFDRIFRFHPVAVGMAELWMFLHRPVAGLIGASTWLQMFFSGIAAVGVWIAISALTSVVPKRLALLGGVLYALCLSIWFFSSIPESKIVSASLSALYLALWLKLRENWNVKGACWLTLILFIACMNEIVASLLVAIPALDELQRRGFDFGKLRWLIAHGIVCLLALVLLEMALPDRLMPRTTVEGTSHFQMFFYYIARSLAKDDYGLQELYAYLLNWFLFSVAAPGKIEICPNCDLNFVPELAGYFLNLWRTTVLVMIFFLLGATLVARLVPTLHTELPSGMRELLIALATYSLLRFAFFFIFNPVEPMLYTPSVMLPHLMLFLIPFTMIKVPAKTGLLAVLTLLLFIANGLFMIGA